MMYVIWDCIRCGNVDAHIEAKDLHTLTCPKCGTPRESSTMKYANNIFFETTAPVAPILRAMFDITRDLVPAKLEDGTVGMVALSIPNADIAKLKIIIIDECIAMSMPIDLTGEKKATLFGTTITIPVMTIRVSNKKILTP